jgi:hypothetical protein
MPPWKERVQREPYDVRSEGFSGRLVRSALCPLSVDDACPGRHGPLCDRVRSRLMRTNPLVTWVNRERFTVGPSELTHSTGSGEQARLWSAGGRRREPSGAMLVGSRDL